MTRPERIGSWLLAGGVENVASQQLIAEGLRPSSKPDRVIQQESAKEQAMRNLAPVSWGLFVVSGIVAIVLWRELRTDRLLIEDLRTQLTEAKAALAAKPPAQSVVALPATPAAQASAATDAPAAPPARITREAATSALIAESAKQQKALLDNADFRKGRLTEARFGLSARFAGLAEEIGLTDREMNALLDLLAENRVSLEAESAALMASGNLRDAAMMADAERRVRELQQKQTDAQIALLGKARYDKFQDFDQTMPSRTRVNNLNNLLTQSGRPLTPEQSKSLTRVIIAEQRRVEKEAQALRAAGQPVPSSQATEPEINRRILEGSASFLDPQQLDRLRQRFEERNAMNRAAGPAQQVQREAAQASSN
jgi:hypothetical protein